MIINKIFFSSIILVLSLFAAFVSYEMYSKVKEAKFVQKNFELISKLKNKISTEYNLPLEEISRDDIIANLPNGTQWEKTLLLNSDSSSTLENSSFVTQEGSFEVEKKEKLKVLALEAVSFSNEIKTSDSSKYIFKPQELNNNTEYKNRQFIRVIKETIENIYISAPKNLAVYEELINSQVAKTNIYKDLSGIDTTSSTLTKKALYFSRSLVSSLKNEKSIKNAKVYNLIKDYL